MRIYSLTPVMHFYLHQAVLHQSQKTLDFLLENGATPSLSFLNGDNLTPLTLAARFFFPACAWAGS